MVVNLNLERRDPEDQGKRKISRAKTAKTAKIMKGIINYKKKITCLFYRNANNTKIIFILKIFIFQLELYTDKYRKSGT